MKSDEIKFIFERDNILMVQSQKFQHVNIHTEYIHSYKNGRAVDINTSSYEIMPFAPLSAWTVFLTLGMLNQPIFQHCRS